MSFWILIIAFGHFIHCSGAEYSNDIRSKFLLHSDVVFLNHGSRGAVPKAVYYRQLKLKLQMEKDPDTWFRTTARNLYMENLKVGAAFVGAEEENMVLVDNASTGLCTAIDSVGMNKGDGILIMDQTYVGVVAKTKQMEHDIGTTTTVVNLPIPLLSANDIVLQYRAALEKDSNIKLAIIDHVTGPTGLILPLEQLVEICHEFGVIVIVDGAHAPGQISLNVENIKADYYIGNFYKWAYASHSCAFLWVAPDHHAKVSPLVISKFYKQSLQEQFNYLGARDTTNFFTLKSALKFYKKKGGLTQITSYCRELLNDARTNLTSALGTISVPINNSLIAPGFLTIILPIRYAGTADELTQNFFIKYKISVLFFKANGQFVVRIMANIYNVPEDYIRLRNALSEFVETINKSAVEEQIQIRTV